MKHIVIILLLLLSEVTFAQHHNFQKFSIEHGLPRSSTFSVIQDTEGFIWVGLEGGGVGMFDGYQYRNFDMSDGLPSQIIRAVFQDSKGIMWFGSSEGLCRWDFNELKVFTIEDGLCDNYIRTIAESPDGRLWIGTNNGLSIYDGENFENLRPPYGVLHKKIRVITVDHLGRVWVGSNNGINIFDGDEMTLLSLDNNLFKTTVLDLYEDSDNRMWVGTKDGVFIWEKDQHLDFYNNEDGLISDRVRAICEDKFGNMWLGTRTGVSKFDGKNFSNFTEENGLSHSRIRDIIRDNQGNLWFATYYGGLTWYSGDGFVEYTMNEGLASSQVFAISEYKGDDMLLGTFDGISQLKFEDNKLDTTYNYTETDGLIGDQVHEIAIDPLGRYWFGTNFGITIKEGDSLWSVTTGDGLPGEEVHAILPVGNDTYWLGTSKGVCQLEWKSNKNMKLTLYPELKEEFKGSDVIAICRDSQDRIWFGYKNGDLIFRSSTGDFIKPKFSSSISRIINLAIDQNLLWVGTEANGLFTIDLASFDLKEENPVKQFTEEDGLASNHIYALLFDDHHNIWIGSEKGIDRIKLDASHNIESTQHFGREAGLTGIEILENACYKDRQGNLWFGNVGGVAVFRTDLYSANETPPMSHLTAINVLGGDDWIKEGYTNELTGRYQLPKTGEFPHDKNSITFNFTGINLNFPEATRYRWMLVGFDQDWSKPSKRRSVNYTNLPSGTYTFKVQAANENGVWSTNETSFTFKVKAPFWEKLWFIILAGVLLIGLIYLISHLRSRKLRKDKEKLELIVEEATDQLRKEKEQVETQSYEIEKQKDELSEINTSITDSINYAKRIQKAIMMPPEDEESLLRQKMFVYYKAKDIVSGDFYWMEEKGNISYAAAADCTGHGVPGAFMSMIGITYLDQILNNKSITKPDQILNALRTNIIQALTSEGADQSKDGMDISFCKFNWEQKKLYFSGANNPVYIIRDKELVEIKGDKMPIGHHINIDQSFTLKEYDLKQGDIVYIFSDGYADQFGGDRGKKFLYSRFKKLLIEISDLELQEQKQILRDRFLEWAGEQEQVDDILVMGIRV